MSLPTWALDPKAQRITVYYEGSSTIYEGMPVCYNYDTTDNWTGAGAITAATTASNLTETGTTAEGSQNEGKFIRVENPASENLQWFAGVVAGSGKSGKTGPCAIDIYVPNGATVPVRAGISCYVGVTLLAIQDSSQSFEQPKYGTAFVVCAIADETVDRTTDGLVLAKLLAPSLFNQGSYDIPLRTGDGVTTGQIRVFERDISTRQTGGEILATVFRTRLKGSGSTCPNGGALFAEVYVEGTNDAPLGRITGAMFNVHLDPGCTIANATGSVDVCGAMTRISETAGSGCTRTNSKMASLFCYTSMDDEHVGALLSQMAFASDGTDKPDVLFYAVTADSIAYTADTTGTNQRGAIKIDIAGVTHYLHTFSATAGAT